MRPIKMVLFNQRLMMAAIIPLTRDARLRSAMAEAVKHTAETIETMKPLPISCQHDDLLVRETDGMQKLQCAACGKSWSLEGKDKLRAKELKGEEPEVGDGHAGRDSKDAAAHSEPGDGSRDSEPLGQGFVEARKTEAG